MYGWRVPHLCIVKTQFTCPRTLREADYQSNFQFKMKKSISTLALAAAFIVALFATGCNSSAEKADKAQDKVVDAKEDLAKAQAKAAEAKMKAAEEWRVYKAESETKIGDNDRAIAELRTKMKASGKKMSAEYSRSIDELEAKSKALRNRIDTYNTDQSDWESFKREFNHDMDEFGQAFKDLTVNNKK